MNWLINEVSRMTGVSTYNLRYYEKEGLICPKRIGDSKYRSYDENDVKRIYCISLYRQLGVPVKDMKVFLDCPNENHVEVLNQVIRLTDERMIKLKNIKRMAELLRFYADVNPDMDEAKRKEYAEDYENLVVIFGKQINELSQYYEEKEKSSQDEEE